MTSYRASFQRIQIADNLVCPTVRFKNCGSRNKLRQQKDQFLIKIVNG
jgi:hypothetical protein